MALHHDSHEAYLCDIPTPLKRKISAINEAYKSVCDEVDLAIAEAFGFRCPKENCLERQAIKVADRQTLLMEAARLLIDGGEALRRDLEIRDEEFRGLALLRESLAPAEVEKRFLQAHTELTGNGLRA